MCERKNNRNLSILIYIFFSVFYFWLAAQIPYTHDDWDWGIDIGLQQFLYATVNSRYVGNFFEIIMTRSVLLKILIMGSTCFFIPYILSSFAAKYLKNNIASSHVFIFVVCNCLLLTVNHILWRQTYGWVAGFANFVISSLFLLFWINEIFITIDSSVVHKKDTLLIFAIYFTVCLLGQLFIENISIYCFLLSIVLISVHIVRYKRIPKRIIAMCIGSFIGLIIMFSSSIYGTLLQDGTAINNYREITIISSTGIIDIIYRTLKSLLFLSIQLYSLNFILSIVILLLFIFYLIKLQPINKSKYCKFYLIIDFVAILAFLFCWINDKVSDNHSTFMYYFDFFLAVSYFFIILLQIISLFHGKIKQVLISLWISAPSVILPLVVTTETGQRLFFTTNIFLVLFALVLLVSLINHISKKEYSILTGIFVCFVAIVLYFYTSLYANIGEVNRTRLKIIDDAILNNKDTIILPSYPNEDYLHNPNPTSSHREEYFKLFYGIPTEVTLIFD